MKRENKGFTLAELLVVVAVIAVLVAVAIPTFSNQLEKSRQAVDVSTLREAYAAAKVITIDGYFMDGTTKVKVKKDDGTVADDVYFYNPKTGEFSASLDGIKSDAYPFGYGSARSGTLVADISSLSDIGVKYDPGMRANKSGTATGVVYATFKKDSDDQLLKLDKLGFVHIVKSDNSDVLDSVNAQAEDAVS